MELQSTVTFEKTYDAYHDMLTEAEFKIRLAEHRRNNLPGFPSYARYRQIVSVGSSRSSKSYSILQLLLTELVSRYGIKVTVWRNMKNICRSTVMEDFQKIIQFDQYIFANFKENKQTGTFTYMPTGSKIVFEGSDSVGKVLGGAQDISFFNEISEFSKEVYLQIKQRTADRVICDYNPSKDFYLEDYRTNPDTVFIHSTFLDNYFCPPNASQTLLSYEPWERGSYEVRGDELFYKGAPISLDNQPPPNKLNIANNTADEFMWMVYGLGLRAERPEKIYRGWREISNQQFEDLSAESFYGLDFGSKHPTAIMEVKYDGDGGLYIRGALHQPIADVKESLSTLIQLKIPQLRKGSSLIVADSAKKDYINLLANDGHNIIGATKGAGSVEVGITLVQKLQIFFVPDPNLQHEYDNYSWDKTRQGIILDFPKKEFDDYMDALRYIVSYLVKYYDIRI